MLLLDDIDSAPEAILRIWWRADLRGEDEAVIERLAMRCEALGLVDSTGKLR